METKPVLSAEDRFDVQDLLFRFMRSFDEKDWTTMRSCLAETVDCDYSSFRGTAPCKIAREEYVIQREAALSLLKTQHNLSNISMVALESKIEARCNYAILRFHPEFDGSQQTFFHSCGQYRFIVARVGEAWSITSITQSLTMSAGNSSLHGAFQNKVRS